MSAKKTGRARGRPRKNGLISRASVVDSDELPDDILEVFDLVLRIGMAAIQDSAQGAPDGPRALLRRRTQTAISKIQQSALLAASAELADWRAVKDLETAPADPAGQALWLTAWLVRILFRLEIGEIVSPADVRSMNTAVRDALATISAAPIYSRVEAARKLRDDRRTAKERPGPATTTGPKKPGLRANGND